VYHSAFIEGVNYFQAGLSWIQDPFHLNSVVISLYSIFIIIFMYKLFALTCQPCQYADTMYEDNFREKPPK